MTTLYKNKVAPCLWFDSQAEDAAKHYTTIFKNSRIVHVSHYGSAGPRPAGMVMVVHFEIDGQDFIALNGGPEFTFDEAISFQVNCDSQAEIDTFWTKFVRRRRGRTVWMGEGQVRRLVADRSHEARRAHP